MEGVVVHHNLRLGNAFVDAVFAGNFDGPLIGLQPGTAEKHIGHACAFGQQGGQLLLQRNVVVVGGVDQLGELLLQRRHQLGVVVSQGIDGNAGQCVQIFFAIGIPHAAALAAFQRDGDTAIGGHNVGGSGRNGHGKISSRKVHRARGDGDIFTRAQKAMILGPLTAIAGAASGAIEG